MLQLIMLLILMVLALVALAGILISGVILITAHLRQKSTYGPTVQLKRMARSLAVILLVTAGLVLFSHITASTPRIVDETGNPVKNSISELIELELNGRRQWISLRGWDMDKPVLLFLAGGPGGTQMAAVRHELSELEKSFVVVNWDQPGSGKSFNSEKMDQITCETYLEDGFALTEYLKKRFSEEKIFLVGESWGSALGIFLIDRYPDSYHAFIGTGQMVDFVQTEQMDYLKALEIAQNKGDDKIVQQLQQNGAPPYFGKDVTWKSAVYLNYLSAFMAGNPVIENRGYDTFRDIGSSEYDLPDKINYFRGIISTFNHVYQQLYDIDLRSDYTKLEVPVYFFLGRHDLNAPTSLVEDYIEVLDAPHKEIIWFERSGHSPWINERDRFVKELKSCLLKEC